MQGTRPWHDRLALPIAGSVALVALAALLLVWMGRDLICPCGYVKLWHGQVPSDQSSQHVLDWWSFSHLIHGFWFYWMLRYGVPRVGIGGRFFLATLMEVVWEVFENSDWVVERYRAATISVDYNGDTILNMVSDVSMMWLGFALAARLPVRVSLLIVVLAELLPMMVIRDGLILNVVMLVWPIEAIARWQAGA